MLFFKYNFEGEKINELKYIHFLITNKKFNILHVQLFKNI